MPEATNTRPFPRSHPIRVWTLAIAYCLIAGVNGKAGAQVTTLPVALSGQPAPGFEAEDGTFEDFFAAFLNDSAQVVFFAGVSVPGAGPNEHAGVWVDGPDGLRLVARQGAALPGVPGETFEFSAPINLLRNVLSAVNIDAAGRVALTSGALASGAFSFTPTSIWSQDGDNLRLVARVGSPAAGLAGTTFTRLAPGGHSFSSTTTIDAGSAVFDTVTFSAGRTAFIARVAGAPDPLASIWSEGSGSLSLLAIEGQVMPGIPPDDFGNPREFLFFREVVLNEAGQTGFAATHTGVTGESRAIYRVAPAGGLELVARFEQAAPGAGDRNFSRFYFLMMNASGQLAFQARAGSVNSPTVRGLWAEGAGGLGLVALENQAAPGTEPGVTFQMFIPVAFSDAGRMVFVGVLEGPGITDANDIGIWTEGDSGLQLVARDGQQIPGKASGVTLPQIRFASRELQVTTNRTGRIAFVARLAIWAQDDEGELIPVFSSSDSTEFAAGEMDFLRGAFDFSPREVGGGPPKMSRGTASGGRPAVFNDDGQLVFRTEQGVFLTHVDARAVDKPVSTANFNYAGTALGSVDTFTGELFLETKDLSLPSPLPLRFSRYYASLISKSGNIDVGMGRNWLHNFTMTLTRNGRHVEVASAKGRILHFEKNGAAWNFLGPRDFLFQLVETGDNFTLGDPDGQLYTFEMDRGLGRLVEIADGKGNAHTLSYNGDGRLIEVADGLGKKLSLTYSGDLLATVSDGTRSVAYEYTNENLTAITDPMGKVTRYSYDSSVPEDGLLTSITQPNGNTPVTIAYVDSPLNRVAYVDSRLVESVTDAGGSAYRLEYLSGTTVLTDPLGNTRRDGHDERGRLSLIEDEAGNVVLLKYDADGRRSAIHDRQGGVTTFVYDEPSGKIAAITEADGTTTEYGYTARDARGIDVLDLTEVRHPNGMADRLTRDSAGNVTTWTDRAGKAWRYAYDDRGLLLSITNPLGGKTTKTYNADGSLASIQDHAGNTTRLNYDTLGRFSGLTHADGTSVALNWNDGDELLSLKDERGQITTYAYDDNGNLTGVTDPVGHTTEYEHDTMDRLVEVRDPETSSATAETTSSMSYDELWRPQTYTLPGGEQATLTYDALSRVTSATHPDGKIWTATYNAEAMLASVTDPDSQTDRFEADVLGRLVRTVSPLGEAIQVAYDSMGLTTRITEPDGGEANYAYDARGFLTGITFPGNVAISYKRNDLGQATEITDANGGVWRVAYDPQGRITSFTDPLDKKTEYAYDSRNRVFNIRFPGDGGTLEAEYDGVGNVTELRYQPPGPPPGGLTKPRATAGDIPANGKRASRQQDGDVPLGPQPPGEQPVPVTLRYEFDPMARLVQTADLLLARDKRGRLVRSNQIKIDYFGDRLKAVVLTKSPQRAIVYQYEEKTGRLIAVRDFFDGVTTFSYDEKGLLKQIVRPNGVITRYRNDAQGNPVFVEEFFKKKDEVGGKILSGLTALVTSGKVTNEVIQGDYKKFVDSLDVAKEERTQGFDRSHKLQVEAFDDHGRLVRDAQRVYSWDLSSQLIFHANAFARIGPGLFEIQTSGNTALAYDGLGSLISRDKLLSSGRKKTSYVWNYGLGTPRISIEKENGNDKWYYVHTPGGMLLYRIAASDGKRFYYHYDLFGHTTMITGDDGAVDAQYAYDPFGAIIGLRFQSSRNHDNRFTYFGLHGWMLEDWIFDEKSRAVPLYYALNRYYDSATMRFISKGFISWADPRTMNPYQLANGDPSLLVRVTGLLTLAVGVVELAVAVPAILTPEPVTSVAGVAVGFLAADNLRTGWRDVWTGQSTQSWVSRGIQLNAEGLGADADTGLIFGTVIDLGLNIAGPIGLTRVLSRSGRIATKGARTAYAADPVNWSGRMIDDIPFDEMIRLHAKHEKAINTLIAAGKNGVPVPAGKLAGMSKAEFMSEISRATGGLEVGLYRVQWQGRSFLSMNLGTSGAVPVPKGALRLIAHIHPSGAMWFSEADKVLMRSLRFGRLALRRRGLLGRGGRSFAKPVERGVLVLPDGHAVLRDIFRLDQTQRRLIKGRPFMVPWKQ